MTDAENRSFLHDVSPSKPLDTPTLVRYSANGLDLIDCQTIAACDKYLDTDNAGHTEGSGDFVSFFDRLFMQPSDELNMCVRGVCSVVDACQDPGQQRRPPLERLIG